jgi:hypothetical protein
MSPKVFLGLAVLTIAACIGAVALSVTQSGPALVNYVDEPAFPELRADPDAVAKVIIRSEGNSVTLVRESPERWIAPERFEYPAAGDRIRDLVVQLADMRLIEAKTSVPARYVRLELQDIDGKDAKSRLIRLEDADGRVLAEALIGKRRFKLTGTEPAGTYIRKVGEEQSWLASGGIELDPEIAAWLDQLVVDIPRERVMSVEVRPAAGEGYKVSRPAAEAPLAVENLAEGESPAQNANLDTLAGVLAAVDLVDVQPRDQLATWPEATQQVVVTTFDGLEVTADLALIEDQPWAVITAATGTLPEDAAAADQVRQEAEALTDRTAGWAFEVNQSFYQRATKPRDSWIEAADGTS